MQYCLAAPVTLKVLEPAREALRVALCLSDEKTNWSSKVQRNRAPKSPLYKQGFTQGQSLTTHLNLPTRGVRTTGTAHEAYSAGYERAEDAGPSSTPWSTVSPERETVWK